MGTSLAPRQAREERLPSLVPLREVEENAVLLLATMRTVLADDLDDLIKERWPVPALSCFRFSKMPFSSQNLRIRRSSDGKSTDVSTFSNGMARASFAGRENCLLYHLTRRRVGRGGVDPPRRTA